MKLLLITVFASIICLSKTQQFSSRFDNINIDDVLSNERVVNNYLKCLLDKGPCTADGRELKKNLPDAILTDCVKCSEAQALGTEKVVKFIRERRPKEWVDIIHKYDPTDSYRGRYS